MRLRVAASWLWLALAFAAPPSAAAPSADRPGRGVYCAYAVFVLAAEVAQRCRVGQDPAFQAQLRNSVSTLESYIRQNAGATAEDLVQFRKDKAHEGAPEAYLCSGDPAALYESLKQKGADKLRAATDTMVAKPGLPTWGTCP